MANKYIYNPQTCRYEPYFVKGAALRKKIATFLSLSMVFGIVGYFFSAQYFQTFDEMLLAEKHHKLKVQWNILHQRIEKAQNNLNQFIDKDDNNYRVILDSSPLAPTIREAGIGGSERRDLKAVEAFPYIHSDFLAIEKLKHKVDIELQSYDEIEKILTGKMISWEARPAISPINNKQLDRLHLTYGLRLHPIFKKYQEHKGLDFAAAHGTPVYATGDGEVSNVYFSSSYGKVIFIDHGDEFETRYAHLSEYAVMIGQPVKRGDLIGYVGNTGNSVAPHLHYEVLQYGEHVNPINFFQRDLSNEEYQKLIDKRSEITTSLD